MRQLLLFWVLFLVPNLLLSQQPITLEFLQSQPKGISRDFYIWLFLQQEHINPKEATQAFKLAYRQNTQLFGLYYKKGDNKTLSQKTLCEQMDLKTLIHQKPSCIAKALTLKKAQTLDKKTLKSLAKKLQSTDALLAKNLQILASKNPFSLLLQTNAHHFASFYFQVSQDFRSKLNQPFPKDKLIQLSAEKSPQFERFIRHAILTQSKAIQQSLAQVPSSLLIPHFEQEALFYLGLNALTLKKPKRALAYFEASNAKTKLSFFKNRALFWSYLASQDELFLHKLSQSKSVDIYTLAALEKTKNPPQYQIIRDIPTHNTQALWDITDPFAWVKIRDSYKTLPKQEQQALLKEVNHQNTKAHLIWLQKDHTKEYFLTPYQESFGQYSQEKQSLLYALGRQESLFIPTAISTSYALGVMQLMPFNVTAIAKERAEQVSLTDMFDPKHNIPYAEYFTRPLIKEFNHPLFVAYAYNGGPGFTRRLLAKKQLFKKERKLDPWYSLEMIPYEESRTYGKKVLANYVIYEQGFGKEIKLLDLLNQTLIY